MRRWLLVSAAIATFITSIVMSFYPSYASIPPASGKNGMVVTDQHIASEVGLQILKAGGNAVDAAVAVGYALAVVQPCCGNIGGGGFMLIHQAKGADIFIDFREKAPLAASPSMYQDKLGNVIPGLSTKGYLAVGVPGTVMGLNQALSEYGTMGLKQVMAPAIEVAEKGFVLQTQDVKFLSSKTKEFQEQPNVAAIFLKDGKTPHQVGDRLVQKNLADTLNLIAQQGADAFYKGAIADEIVKASSQHGGILSKQDFIKYTAPQTSPLSCNYRGYEVMTAPPPGGGTTLCEMQNIVDGYPLGKLGFHSAASLHPMLEAMLYAYADRNKYLGDPAFVKNPLQRLLSKQYATQIRAQISPNRATPPQQVYPSIASPEGTHTTHYSIADSQGNAVAVTYTINYYFGAGVIAGNTGFFLNNEMDDFTSKPGVPNSFGLVQGTANAITPGKRPLSSMSPTIVTQGFAGASSGDFLEQAQNGKVFIVTGSPGGSTITTTVLQVISNVIDYGMNIEQAVNTPRIHYQGLPNVVVIEPNALSTTAESNLSQMGYKFKQLQSLNSGQGAESILVNPETKLLYGANDIRRPAGAALGY
ncbi:MAG: gamma-glutamyltransferase [Chroococcidiopsidaceae cyanobacterium CP_BM_ER_R8_30]|nr:gamma-glutamyltransferase [Chroococcidiopsidaceae cyanobacterium CP_BM_ER_R8_30]